jgi:hypothetical protein
MGANLLQGPLDGVGPENLDFFGRNWPSLRRDGGGGVQGVAGSQPMSIAVHIT